MEKKEKQISVCTVLFLTASTETTQYLAITIKRLDL